MPVFLNSQSSNFEKEFKKLLSAKRENSVDVDLSVRDIIDGVIDRGDQALIEYTKRFDRINLTSDKLRFITGPKPFLIKYFFESHLTHHK